ncbi:MAG: hypothetical protein GWP39_00200 [Planctomycetia bacterium]|nr:hypothetical protein [Planctomycetia bacterium]NCG13217.1 hypothetical protein [Planctomycetia bacterium]
MAIRVLASQFVSDAQRLNRLKWISKPQGRFDISHAIVIEAIYQWAVSLDEIGQVFESHKLYEEFFEFWGVADTRMPQVTQARNRRVELDSQ